MTASMGELPAITNAATASDSTNCGTGGVNDARISERKAFRLGRFLVDPRRNRVSGPHGTASLQPKVMDVLCLLAEEAGKVLSRSELIDRVWGVEHGADESLTQAVSQLRKVFNDSREDPRFIETISKRGYRLIVPPAAPPPPAGSRAQSHVVLVALAIIAVVAIVAAVGYLLTLPSPPRLGPAARTGIVILVQPFTSDRSWSAADGFAGQLSAAIARSPLVRARLASDAVSPRQTMAFRLRGHIRRVESRLRLDTELVDGRTGDVVWGETYDRPYDAQFSARDSLIETISGELLLPLLARAKERLARQPLRSLEPWELTLLVTWIPGSEAEPPGPPVEDSYWLQRRALELEPDYAPAHALFAELAAYHALFHPPADIRAARERARRHAERAIELAPFDSEVLYRVSLYYRYSGDRDRARALLDRVLQLQPNHPLARLDRAAVDGHCTSGAPASIARLKALEAEMSPANPARWVALSHLSALYLATGEFEQARDAAQRARNIVPQMWTAMTLAAAGGELKLDSEARATLLKHRAEWPNLDLRYFSEKVVPRWCMAGDRTQQVQASFRRLAGGS